MKYKEKGAMRLKGYECSSQNILWVLFFNENCEISALALYFVLTSVSADLVFVLLHGEDSA